jgi:xylulose-5-phosphate/fructose-6-phosphate phosphoketolase
LRSKGGRRPVNRPILFNFQGYPWLIHRLTYRRRGHANLHVRGYVEEGTTTTPFDICVRNRIDRCSLVLDVIHRVPGPAGRAGHIKRTVEDRLASHEKYICRHGDGMPKVRNWHRG